MNVCLISREYPPFFGGGIGTYAVQWSKALAAAGHRVIVVTVTDDGVERREVQDGVTVVRLPFLKGNDWDAPHPAIATPAVSAAFRALHPVSAFAMQIESAMPRLVREFGIEIIEAPDTGAAAWFGLNNRRAGGTWAALPPVVTTIHSPSAWIARYNRQALRGRIDHELIAMERDSAAWSDALLCPSNALADWSAEHWGVPRDSIEVIPYPLGDLEPRAEAMAKGGAAARSDDGQFRVLFVGRLEPRKGVDTLLAAAAHLNGSGRETVVDLVGEDTPDPSGRGLFGANSLRALVPDEMKGRVRILGRRAPSELPGLRDAADAVVIPSPMDNYPYVCIESMAEGRFVIASSAGGTGEMIRDGEDGILFRAGDVASCAQALQRAAHASGAERARMRKSTATRILEICGNRSIIDRRVDHYRRTIERARTATPVRASASVAIVNAGDAPPAALERLAAAMNSAGADFAHGWPATRADGVLAYSTPSIRSLSMSPRVIGPMAIRSSAAAAEGVAELLRPDTRGGEGRFGSDSSWIVAMALCEAGFKGLVVPDVTVDVPDSLLHPLDSGPIVELATVYSSRGWKVLERMYDLLHIIRGRGLKRPEYDGSCRGLARPRGDRDKTA